MAVLYIHVQGGRAGGWEPLGLGGEGGDGQGLADWTSDQTCVFWGLKLKWGLEVCLHVCEHVHVCSGMCEVGIDACVYQVIHICICVHGVTGEKELGLWQLDLSLTPDMDEDQLVLVLFFQCL